MSISLRDSSNQNVIIHPLFSLNQNPYLFLYCFLLKVNIYLCVHFSFIYISFTKLLPKLSPKITFRANIVYVFEWIQVTDSCEKSVINEWLFYLGNDGHHLLAHYLADVRNVLKRACSTTQPHTHTVSILQLLFIVCYFPLLPLLSLLLSLLLPLLFIALHYVYLATALNSGKLVSQFPLDSLSFYISFLDCFH